VSKKAHKTIEQTYQQPVIKTICAQRGCKFCGGVAQQGVCYSSKGEVADWDKLDAHERQLAAELRQLKKREGADYVRALEANWMTAMMNWQITLDECIRLRRDAALRKPRRK